MSWPNLILWSHCKVYFLFIFATRSTTGHNNDYSENILDTYYLPTFIPDIKFNEISEYRLIIVINYKFVRSVLVFDWNTAICILCKLLSSFYYVNIKHICDDVYDATKTYLFHYLNDRDQNANEQNMKIYQIQYTN